jgi:3'-5' exoribonuclease
MPRDADTPPLRCETVAELKARPADESRPFTSVLLYLRGTKRRAKNGNEFLVAELGDRSGTFSATCFGDGAAFAFFEAQAEGTVVRVEGVADRYQGKFSPRLTSVTPLTPEEIADGAWLSQLVASSPEDPEALWNELQETIGAIAHEGLRATARQVFEDIGDRFRAAPAAVAMHHAYRHGLLEHTVHVARLARALLPLYPEVDPSLALAGVLLHDIGKTIEYEGDLAPARGRTGILQGHVLLGYRLVRQAAMKIKPRLDPVVLERLEHIILSHQGELEWGAAVLAATPEAVFVALADNFDAKMGMVQSALRNTPPGQQFSDYMPGLKASLLTTPPPASSAETSAPDAG